MHVKLLDHTKITNCVIAARTCYDSFHKMDSDIEKDILGENDKKLLKKLLDKGHTSIFEHLVYVFNIKGISRGCLQQLVRHRIASYSVQSTRYTLNKFLNKMQDELEYPHKFTKDIIDEHFVIPFDDSTPIDKDTAINEIYLPFIKILFENKDILRNDLLKYLIPESWKTELVMTINARSLMNFFHLRTDKTAHLEIRELALLMYRCIPDEHKFLFERFVQK